MFNVSAAKASNVSQFIHLLLTLITSRSGSNRQLERGRLSKARTPCSGAPVGQTSLAQHQSCG